jgi:N-acetyl sugar amidotransferase
MNASSLSQVQFCKRCIYSSRDFGISFDSTGVCTNCLQVDSLQKQFGTGSERGLKELERILLKIRKIGKNQKYDCVIGVSGGTDSSYLLYLAKEWGLRPLAVHYDNTWNSSIATLNIASVLNALGIDLYTHVVDNEEADDIFRAFWNAGVAELEASTDLGFAYTLRKVASKKKIKFILEGHSFVTEGITPLNRNYFDGKYISEIHNRFGELPIQTYPLMTFSRFMKSILKDRTVFIRPFWYIDYSKENAREFLTENFGWKYYGGHHLENRMSAFLHSVYLPGKFDTDLRVNTLAAQVRSGKISREQALLELSFPPHVELGLVEYFCKRMKIDKEEFDRVMKLKPHSWSEFPTYRPLFKRFRLIFRIFASFNLIPMSFYKKYCF